MFLLDTQNLQWNSPTRSDHELLRIHNQCWVPFALRESPCTSTFVWFIMHIYWCMVVSSSHVASLLTVTGKTFIKPLKVCHRQCCRMQKEKKMIETELVMWKSIMFWNWPWKNLLSLTERWLALLGSPHSTIPGWNKARNLEKLSITVSLKYKCVFSHLHKCLNNNHMLHLQVFILLKQQKHWKICHLKWPFQLFFQFQVEPSGQEGFIHLKKILSRYLDL